MDAVEEVGQGGCGQGRAQRQERDADVLHFQDLHARFVADQRHQGFDQRPEQQSCCADQDG
jgi:hypothetical protein